MRYRRAWVKGGCFFFTVVTSGRRPVFADPESIERFKAACRQVKASHPFRMQALVILPDHIHCLWRLPESDCDSATRWRLIKHYVTRGLKGGYGSVWQARYWEHLVRDENDWRRHTDYLHYNPVKHGYVTRPEDWPYSTYRKFVGRGWYEKGSSAPRIRA